MCHICKHLRMHVTDRHSSEGLCDEFEQGGLNGVPFPTPRLNRTQT